MASWTEDILEPGETVVYRARATCRQVAVATAVFFVVLCFINVIVTPNPVTVLYWATVFTLCMGLPVRLGETVITDRRVLQWTPMLFTESTSALALGSVVSVERTSGYLGDQILITANGETSTGKSRINQVHCGIIADPESFLAALLSVLPEKEISFRDKCANRKTQMALNVTIAVLILSGLAAYLALAACLWPLIDEGMIAQSDTIFYGAILGLFLLMPICIFAVAWIGQFVAIVAWSYFLTLEEMRQFAILNLGLDRETAPSRLPRWTIRIWSRLIAWLYQTPVELRPNAAVTLSGPPPERD